jgi:hypothetical protein
VPAGPIRGLFEHARKGHSEQTLRSKNFGCTDDGAGEIWTVVKLALDFQGRVFKYLVSSTQYLDKEQAALVHGRLVEVFGV